MLPVVQPHGPPLLRARFGELNLPYVSLGAFPTPLEPLEALSRELGCEVWVKRDDRSGALYGGNKVRKLELLLAHALARGRKRVVTFGAYGSHHCLATATYARMLGLDVRLALYPQPLTAHVLDDLILSHAAGAELHHMSHVVYFPLATLIWKAQSRSGELIPAGGSSPLGSLGYVEAGLELAAQVAAGDAPAPDLIFVAAGTCGTAAGLALGLELAGLSCEVVAVRVVPAVVTNAYAISRLRARSLALLREVGAEAEPTGAVSVELDPHELGSGYGVETEAGRAAMLRFAEHGVQLETTYTGKTAAALLRWAEGPARGRRVLFWNTFSSVDLQPRLSAADPASLPEPFLPALREGGRLP